MRFGWLIFLLLLVSCKKDFHDLDTKVIGHAGESLLPSRSENPPNSIESVMKALEMGADGVEVDVQMTADSALVAFHDLSLDYNSSGSGCINAMTFDDIDDLTIYKTDERIDTLRKFFSATIETGHSIFLDVKHYNECENKAIDYSVFDRALNRIINDWSEEEKALITVNSSDIGLLAAITDTVVQISYESDNADWAIPFILENGYDMLTIKLTEITTEAATLLKSSNIKLVIYNVKTRSDINKALEFAPDFVISDNIPCTIKSIHG